MDAEELGIARGRVFRFLVTGGGTGGHTFPALTTVRALRARMTAAGAVLDVLWVGSGGSLEQQVAESEGIPFRSVANGKLRRASNPLRMASPANVRDMARVPLGVAQARRVVAQYKPDAVLATGGYVAIPVGVAARLCRRPLVVHEQTVRLGMANEALAKLATAVAVSSPSTVPLLPAAARQTAAVTGNPVRPEIFTGDATKAVEALGLQGFDLGRPTVYVTGGAQGSQQINALTAAVLPWLLHHANVIHQCGPDNVASVRRAVEQDTRLMPGDAQGRYLLTGFIGPELPDVLALADVVISRSGAGTIAELTALGKPSVLIPLASSAGGEQEHNARHLADTGAALALVGEVTAAALRNAVVPLLAGRARREAMARRARELGRPDAAERLADIVLSAARGTL